MENHSETPDRSEQEDGDPAQMLTNAVLQMSALVNDLPQAQRIVFHHHLIEVLRAANALVLKTMQHAQETEMLRRFLQDSHDAIAKLGL